MHEIKVSIMLDNIFLMAMPNDILENVDQNSENRNIIENIKIELAYPDDGEQFHKDHICSQIFEVYKGVFQKDLSQEDYSIGFLHSHSRVLHIKNQSFLISPLPNNYILGLVFHEDENPHNYVHELVKLMKEYFLEAYSNFRENPDNKEEINNLLLTLFVDIRRYGDEIETHQEEQNHVAIFNKVPMIKAFVYGIDNAGKSSLMRLLSTGKFDHDFFRPTKKFRITNIDLDSGAKLVCWDMPGQNVFRQDWLRGAQSSNIVIFVLDTNDKTRFEEARKAFWNMLNLYELKGLPLIFLANKMDLPHNGITELDIIKKFQLNKINNRSSHLILTSLPERRGIEELLDEINRECNRLLLLNGIEYLSQTGSTGKEILDNK